jgi:hypothetical protein
MAAGCAVQAGIGRGSDAPCGEDERAALRSQARAWLRAELATWQKQADGGPEQSRLGVLRIMNYLRTQNAYHGVRDAQALEQLPSPERDEWQRYWADVAVLHARATTEIERLVARTMEPPPADAVAHLQRGR